MSNDATLGGLLAQILNPRYRSSAICQGLDTHERVVIGRSAADSKSAIPQTASLRYRLVHRPARLVGCLPRNSACTAFTLIEVILAIGIMAIALVAINTAFFAAVRLRQKTTQQLEQAQPVEQALAVLRRDLLNAAGPGGVMEGDFRGSAFGGGIGGSSTSSKTKSANSSQAAQNTLASQNPGSLDFFTTTGTLSDNAPWADMQEVNYQLVDAADRAHSFGRDLVRNVNRSLLAVATATPEAQRLLSNVESLDFYYFDGMNWQESWDTTSGNTNLPVAVRVRLRLGQDPAVASQRLEPIEMVVLLHTQTRTNS